MKQYTIRFLPHNKKVQIRSGTTLLAAATSAGIELESVCGGKGKCGKCIVRVEAIGATNAGLEESKKVLACQTKIRSDMTVHIPPVAVSVQRKGEITLLDAVAGLEINSGLRKVCVQIKEPTLSSQLPDWDRLLEGLGARAEPTGQGNPSREGTLQNTFDVSDVRSELRSEAIQKSKPKACLEMLRKLPGALREKNHEVTAVAYESKIIAVEAGDTTKKLYGVAVDLGTTTLAASLLDLNTGENLGTASAANIQNIYGADIISRITYCNENEGGLEDLHTRAVQVINSLMSELCDSVDVSSANVYQMTVVGNTTMTHFFTKLDPVHLASAPFVPVITRRMLLEARDLGLHTAPHAQVHVLPSIAGYLGADTVGVILATGLQLDRGIKLAIDIGTNGEIVLASDGQMIACSTAAGPAFEGAQIEYGMRAAEGAIERIIINNDVEFKTIGGYKARGLCGSGLIDAVAEMMKAGIVDASGKLASHQDAAHLPEALQNRIGSGEHGKFFILAFEEETSFDGVVLLTQKDIRQLQLAKGAINAGIRILMAEFGITPDDLDKIFLAGAFGNYINKESALTIGLIPPVALDKIESVGNAAGVGAQMALLSKPMREATDQIARKVKNLELSVHKDFQELFIRSLESMAYFQGS